MPLNKETKQNPLENVQVGANGSSWDSILNTSKSSNYHCCWEWYYVNSVHNLGGRGEFVVFPYSSVTGS